MLKLVLKNWHFVSLILTSLLWPQVSVCRLIGRSVSYDLLNVLEVTHLLEHLLWLFRPEYPAYPQYWRLPLVRRIDHSVFFFIIFMKYSKWDAVVRGWCHGLRTVCHAISRNCKTTVYWMSWKHRKFCVYIRKTDS